MYPIAQFIIFMGCHHFTFNETQPDLLIPPSPATFSLILHASLSSCNVSSQELTLPPFFLFPHTRAPASSISSIYKIDPEFYITSFTFTVLACHIYHLLLGQLQGLLLFLHIFFTTSSINTCFYPLLRISSDS